MESLDRCFRHSKKVEINGNNGMHQSVLILAAIVMDSMPESQEWIELAFQSGESGLTSATGGNIDKTFVDDVDRDGAGNEGTSDYNGIWLSRYKMIADMLKDYVLEGSTMTFDMNLYNNAKFKKMFKAEYPLILSDIFCPTTRR